MLGDNIRKYRKENNISQEKLAEELGVTRQSISLWENDQTQPSLENIVALAKVFNISTDDLLLSTKEGNIEEIITEDKITNDITLPPKVNKKFLIWISVAVCTILVAVVLLFLKPWSSDSIILAKPFSEDVDAIAEKEASVVKVFCYDHKGNEIATGSGVQLFENDLIITNYHVVEDAFSVKISTDQDFSYEAGGLWQYNEKKDIAFIRLKEKTNLPLLTTGDSSIIKKGETVTAIGSPLGIKNTVSKGNLSGRVMQKNFDALQFTAPISNGSSGGALFDESGNVIGITYASYTDGQNLNLAIPIEIVCEMYETNLTTTISPFSDSYWASRGEEYFDYTYGSPVSVTFNDLKKSPEKYQDQMIKVEACVSSVDKIGEKRMGIYITKQTDVHSNSDNDDQYLNEKYSSHDLIYVSTNKLTATPDIGISDNVVINSADKVLITGVFEIDASGNYRINAGKIDFS